MATVTSNANYFEDLMPGTRFRHTRARTLSHHENTEITLSSLNTAQAHFDLDFTATVLDGAFTERLVMGGYTLAIVIGLTSEDLSENAIADVGLRDVTFSSVVYGGDTLHASSEVLSAQASHREDAGLVSYRFTGTKTDGTVVVKGVRDVLVKRRSHWLIDSAEAVAHE